MPSFIIQELKKENDQLCQLLNKYHESINTNKISDDFKTKMVYNICVGCK